MKDGGWFSALFGSGREYNGATDTNQGLGGWDKSDVEDSNNKLKETEISSAQWKEQAQRKTNIGVHRVDHSSAGICTVKQSQQWRVPRVLKKVNSGDSTYLEK